MERKFATRDLAPKLTSGPNGIRARKSIDAGSPRPRLADLALI